MINTPKHAKNEKLVKFNHRQPTKQKEQRKKKRNKLHFRWNLSSAKKRMGPFSTKYFAHLKKKKLFKNAL